jgi:LysM repeat protein
VNEDRLRVWIARLAAPLAFFFAATVLILLVESGLGSDNSEATRTTAATTPTETAPRTTTGETGKTERKRKKRFYRVRAGDTLESIAARFDTEVEALLALNPAIDDPLALQPGQRIRIS